MSGFTIDITGDFEGKLDNITEEIKRIVDDELSAFGLETVAMAKALCPVDEGFLRNSITFDKQPLSVEIIVAANYAAYVEFGTGVFAAAYVPTLPAGLQAYARTFYINGKGTMFAHPFLFPALETNRIKLISSLKKQLNVK